jgi:hypothetical protein
MTELRAGRSLDDLMAACEATVSEAAGDEQMVGGIFVRRHSSTLRAVVKELRTGMSSADILALLGVILDLIQALGPIVDEIVKRIREWKHPVPPQAV